MKLSKKAPASNKTRYMTPFNRDLNYFIACAQEGNILKASEVLDIQQAGLSKIIAKLEYDIGEKLFIRSTRGVKLTEYGKVLYESLMQTRSYWDEIYFNQTKKGLDGIGRLKIGAHPSIAASNFSKFLQPLLEKFPTLILETEMSTSLEVTRKVAQLEIDLGIVINPVKNAELVSKVICDEFVGLWSRNKNFDKVLLYNPDMFMNQRLLKRFADYRLVPVRDYEVISSVVKSTSYCGILPNPVAERHGLHPVGSKVLSAQLALIWHKDRFRSTQKYEVVELILEKLKC